MKLKVCYLGFRRKAFKSDGVSLPRQPTRHSKCLSFKVLNSRVVIVIIHSTVSAILYNNYVLLFSIKYLLWVARNNPADVTLTAAPVIKYIN